MRIKGLDFLRGIAVLLVIFRHASSGNIIANIGWIGVDLFFVLSGFLVSGLVFKEYLSTKSVKVSRFLIKRGFKIYPAFYFFIFVTIVLNYVQTRGFYSLSQILNEVFYLQSYRDGIWYHTWSLAIEEHFYIGLAIFIFVSIKTKLIEKRGFIGYFLICMLIASFLMRLNVSYPNRDKEFFSFIATHLRMDGILIGVLTSYVYYFTGYYKIFAKYKYWFFGLAAILISPVFFYAGGSYFMNTIGITTVTLGFGLLVLFSLTGFKVNNRIILSITNIPLIVLCFIGVHSYSIYLWHLMSEKIVRSIDGYQPYYTILFLIVSLSLGIIMSYVIERPFLKLRSNIYKKE